MMDRINFIIGWISMVFLFITFLLVNLFQGLYNLLTFELFITIDLFLMVALIFRTLETYRNKLAKFKPTGEGEKLMHLRRSRSLSYSIFLWSIGLAFLIPSLGSFTDNTTLFSLSMVFLVLGATYWYFGYLRRDYFLEKHYQKEKSL